MDALQEGLQETVRVLTSRSVRRTAVNVVLLSSGASILLGLASIATALFFQNFVPDQVVTKLIHLQYGSGINPYGLVPLTMPPMKTQQEYDVSVELSLPRSPANIDRGNFMIDLRLLDSKIDLRLIDAAQEHAQSRGGFGNTNVVFSSRRPALLPYVDPVVSTASRVLFLFYHIFFPGSSTTTMRVPLAERVMFAKGSVLPSTAYVEIEAGQSIQIYHAALSLTAQLSGLRWLMFHYRLPTYFAFTFLFWVSEVVFMMVAWFAWITVTASSNEAGLQGKQAEGRGRKAIEGMEESEGQGDVSDPPETFPTYGRQPPLKYEPRVKVEQQEEQPLSELPVGGAEADDELDDDDGEVSKQVDSGIGTSYSAEGLSSVRKRASLK